jgi:glycosyltransferase involved in cell wall biosynthesis
MNDDEMHALYTHPKINALLSLTHGEGFGLPLFEAAYSGLPTIAPGWSGQLDFLVNKNTNEDFYYKVEHTLNNIPKEVVWDGVIIEESSWAYPEENSSKQEMRRCYEDLTLDNAEATKEKFLQHANYLHEAVHLSPNNNDVQDIDILEF